MEQLATICLIADSLHMYKTIGLRPAPTSKECKSCPDRTSHKCATWSAVTVTTVCPCGAMLPLINCWRCCSSARQRPERMSQTRAVLSKATVSKRRPAPSRHPMLMLSSCPAPIHIPVMQPGYYCVASQLPAKTQAGPANRLCPTRSSTQTDML